MPRTPLPPEAVERFRARVCRVVTRQLAERGPAGISMRQVAAELGCSPMTPYRYFRDREAIFTAVRAAAFARFADAMTAAAAAAPPDPAARLARLGEAYLRHARSAPHEYRIMFELAQPQGADDPGLAREETRAWSVLREAVAAAVDAGVIREDADTAAHVLWAGLHGLAALDLAGKLRTRSRDELAGPMMFALLRGVGAPDAAGPARCPNGRPRKRRPS